jgi:hypothetical protein
MLPLTRASHTPGPDHLDSKTIPSVLRVSSGFDPGLIRVCSVSPLVPLLCVLSYCASGFAGFACFDSLIFPGSMIRGLVVSYLRRESLTEQSRTRSDWSGVTQSQCDRPGGLPS